MYFTDSCGSKVWAWDFDPAMARLKISVCSSTDSLKELAMAQQSSRRMLLAHDNLSRARYCVYDPRGQLMRTLELPTDIPTCCEFGGRNLDVLYITTATLGRFRRELESQSHAGGLFAVDVGVTGLPASPRRMIVGIRCQFVYRR